MTQARASDAFQEALLEDDPVQLYERAPCGYLSTTPDGLIVKANETFLTWTGYASGEIIGRFFVDLLSAGGRIYHETHYSPMLRMQGAVHEIAADIVRSDGSRLPVLLNARLDRDDLGHPRVVRIAVFDATQRREYERELLRAKERAEESEHRSRSLARTLQATLIPPSTPTIPHLGLAAAYRPAGDGTVVGGDFYDVFPIAPGEWVVVLGDVCGKGPEAAVVTAFVRHSVRALAFSEELPSQVLSQLDQLLQQHATDRFCTCVLLRLRRDGTDWVAGVSVGGHPAPVLLRRGGEPQLLPVRGSLVGALPEAAFADHEFRLHRGDALVLYTDGITEARSSGRFFGEVGLLGSVRRSAGVSTVGRDGEGFAGELVSGLVGEALDFQAGVPRDDIAVVALAVPR